MTKDEALTLTQPAQGWKLREVYFDEDGEPSMHREPEQEPEAWAIQGCSNMWRGEFAEIDAKAEAKRIGGTCVAYALYTTPQQRPRVGLTGEMFLKAAQASLAPEIAFARVIAAAEREACAKVVIDIAKNESLIALVLEAVADAIRARGNT